MKKLTEDFNDFIDIISLNKTKEKDIISKHTELTDMIKRDVPDGYEIVKTRLSGSYAKNTVINEYDSNKKPDVDIVVIIKPVDKSVDDINNDFIDYFINKKGKVVSKIRQQSNSIGLIYSNISADIVIANYIDNSGTIQISSHKRHEWVESNSLKQIEYMKVQKKKYEGFNYYDLMKLFKYLNKEILTYPLKSYTLEQLVHQCSPMPRVGLRLYQAFSETLENITTLSSITEIKDCCDKTKKGYDDKDLSTFNKFLDEISRYSEMAKEALKGNRTQWEKIFGERFPKQPKEIVKNGANYDKKQTPWCY
ncbi:MAG: hypothetical protein MR598_00595 [Erysipelotrichaceae bacterium]|nr:hypothetical protein [Erysipelotrichaceae bacterium]